MENLLKDTIEWGLTTLLHDHCFTFQFLFDRTIWKFLFSQFHFFDKFQIRKFSMEVLK